MKGFAYMQLLGLISGSNIIEFGDDIAQQTVNDSRVMMNNHVEQIGPNQTLHFALVKQYANKFNSMLYSSATKL